MTEQCPFICRLLYRWAVGQWGQDETRHGYRRWPSRYRSVSHFIQPARYIFSARYIFRRELKCRPVIRSGSAAPRVEPARLHALIASVPRPRRLKIWHAQPTDVAYFFLSETREFRLPETRNVNSFIIPISRRKSSINPNRQQQQQQQSKRLYPAENG